MIEGPEISGQLESTNRVGEFLGFFVGVAAVVVLLGLAAWTGYAVGTHNSEPEFEYYTFRCFKDGVRYSEDNQPIVFRALIAVPHKIPRSGELVTGAHDDPCVITSTGLTTTRKIK